LDKQSVLRTVGLFRLSGSAPLIKKLSDDIDAGKNVDFTHIADPHTVTGLLKVSATNRRLLRQNSKKTLTLTPDSYQI
jgi:hypothetical protein